MATVFDSSVADTPAGGLMLMDTGKRHSAGVFFLTSLAPLTSLSDAKTVLEIRAQMPNVAFINMADATDDTSAIALANANKAKINELIQVMVNVNLMAAASS